MALSLNHVHLKSPDPHKTAQFYIDTLGATKIADVGEVGVRLDLHGLTLNVTRHIETQTREQKYGMEHIAIDADDIQGMIDMLKAIRRHDPGGSRRHRGSPRCLFRGPRWRATGVHRE